MPARDLLPDGPAEEIATAIAILRQATSTPDLRRCLASLSAAAERQGRIARELEHDADGQSPPYATVGSPGEAIRRLAQFHRALQDRFNAVATSLGGRVVQALAVVDAGTLGFLPRGLGGSTLGFLPRGFGGRAP